MLSLEQFRKDMKKTTLAEASELFGIEPEFFGPHAESVFVSHEMCMTRMADGRFWAIVGRDEEMGDFNNVSAFLYFGFYLFECEGAHDLDGLSAALEAFCAWRALKPMCAMELRHELMAQEPSARDFATRWNIQWLGDFCDVWRRVELEGVAA